MHRNTGLKFFVLLSISVGSGLLGARMGLNSQQSLAVSIFLVSVLGTLFFWDFRLSFAFLGTSILLLTRTIDLENLVKSASLEVILFLVGMMVLIGLLKEGGVFAWLVSLILRIKNLSAKKFLISISLISAFLACAVDEVTSIIFMVVAILEICDYFEVNPVPFVITSVITTNIGSAGTVLGNPIGILIASKFGLTFEDFILRAFPLMLVCLLAAITVVYFWYRKPLKEFDRRIKELGANEILIRLISVPPEKGLKISLGIFGITLLFIALHRRLELLWNLQPNTILLIVPLISSGLVMLWKWKRARFYIEHDVEWWTLLFFLFLFAQAGTLRYTGATDVFARRISLLAGHNLLVLAGFILWVSAIVRAYWITLSWLPHSFPLYRVFRHSGLTCVPYGGRCSSAAAWAGILRL